MINLSLFYDEKITLSVTDNKTYFDILDILTLRGVKCCGKPPHCFDNMIDDSNLFLSIENGLLVITKPIEYNFIDDKYKRPTIDLWSNEIH